jgi:glutamyl-tRNA reductase
VIALRDRFDAIRRSELKRLDTRLAGLDADERARVDEVTRLIVEKLLVEPTEHLKALPDEETQVAYTDAVRRLFGLHEGGDLTVGPRPQGSGLRADSGPRRSNGQEPDS